MDLKIGVDESYYPIDWFFPIDIKIKGEDGDDLAGVEFLVEEYMGIYTDRNKGEE